MSDFRGNIDNWLRLAEPDYYTLFIRCWIPFNAWYVAEMPQHEKKDHLLIKELQDHPKSKPRLRIEYLLTHDDDESQKFQYHLIQLFHHLDKRSLHHNAVLLSLKSVELSTNNVKHAHLVDKYGNKYKAEVKTGFFEAVIVDKNSKTLLHYKHPNHDIQHLKHDLKFIGLNDVKVQSNISNCYEAIDPTKPTELITNSKNKSDYITFESDKKLKFINDPATIAKACIKVFYALRCMLFHGEVDPTINNAAVFEHAFFMLNLVVKDLK